MRRLDLDNIPTISGMLTDTIALFEVKSWQAPWHIGGIEQTVDEIPGVEWPCHHVLSLLDIAFEAARWHRRPCRGQPGITASGSCPRNSAIIASFCSDGN